MFVAERFVGACRAAASLDEPVAAVREVVAAAIADGGAVDAALGSGYKRERDTLLSSVDLTVQRIVWAPGMLSPPHEHRMWAVVGVYDGEERNRLYERVSAGLTERGCHDVGRGEVFVLDATAIHSVENVGRVRTAGLHVYGGDILNVERSAWGPDDREVSVVDNIWRAPLCTRQCD